jgi:hypothetical protein
MRLRELFKKQTEDRQKTDPRYNVESANLTEIERLGKSGFEGGKEYLDVEYGSTKTIKPLPGGSGLLYSITNDSGDIEVKLWDKINKGEYEFTPEPKKLSWYNSREHASRVEYWKQRNERRKEEFDKAPGRLVGKLSLHNVGPGFPLRFPLSGALQVGTITVDEQYRGVGLAKALYGIVLTIMKRPLLAGASQTPGGRRNWMSLSQIPGVEMKGFFKVDNWDLETDDPADARGASDKRYIASKNKAAENRIDTIMGKLGGQYLGKGREGYQYFAFDVQPNTTKKELQAYVDTNLSKVYGNYNSDTGLYAVWRGQ